MSERPVITTIHDAVFDHDGQLVSVILGPVNQIPHTCSDPTCPGNINRQKLELWGELVDSLRRCVLVMEHANPKAFDNGVEHNGRDEGDVIAGHSISDAHSLLTRAAAIPAQGGESG